MKLNLCIDIDGTITEPFYWLEMANNYFGTSVKPSQVTTYDIHEVLNIPREEYQNFYDSYGKQLHAQAKIREDAQQILRVLNEKHNIFYVTARELRMESVTRQWFWQNGLPEGELHLLGTHHKVEKAKELNCHIFIEDRYENALQLVSAGFKVLLIDCYYNRSSLAAGITRVYNWKNIHEEICKYEVKVRKTNRKSA